MNERNYPLAVAAAKKIIADLHITDPDHIQIGKIAADRNAFVTEGPIKGSAARLVREDSIALITVDKKIREPGRKRFAIAHELGHFELHKAKDQIANCTDEMFLSWYKSRPEEPEANVFAAEILMPGEIFKKHSNLASPNFDEIRNLAETFRTTITATAIRYIEHTHHPCTLIVSESGIIKWFIHGQNFPYRTIAPGAKVSKYSCANDYFTSQQVPDQPEVVSGDTWLEDVLAGKDIVLYEHAFPLPRYNTVLSLIWTSEK